MHAIVARRQADRGETSDRIVCSKQQAQLARAPKMARRFQNQQMRWWRRCIALYTTTGTVATPASPSCLYQCRRINTSFGVDLRAMSHCATRYEPNFAQRWILCAKAQGHMSGKRVYQSVFREINVMAFVGHCEFLSYEFCLIAQLDMSPTSPQRWILCAKAQGHMSGKRVYQSVFREINVMAFVGHSESLPYEFGGTQKRHGGFYKSKYPKMFTFYTAHTFDS